MHDMMIIKGSHIFPVDSNPQQEPDTHVLDTAPANLVQDVIQQTPPTPPLAFHASFDHIDIPVTDPSPEEARRRFPGSLFAVLAGDLRNEISHLTIIDEY